MTCCKNLISAANNGHIECMNELTTHSYIDNINNIDVNITDYHGNTALILAACGGHIDCVKLLLTVPQIDVNTVGKNGETALILAAQWGYIDCVTELLNVSHINVNVVNKWGSTALILAACGGYIDCVKVLLSVPQIDVNIVDKADDTALIWVDFWGHTEIKTILENNIKIHDVAASFLKKALPAGWKEYQKVIEEGEKLFLKATRLKDQIKTRLEEIDEYCTTPEFIEATLGEVLPDL